MVKRTQMATEQRKDPLAGLREYLEINQYQTVYQRARDKSDPLCLFLHGCLEQIGTVQKEDKYELDFIHESGTLDRIHKVKVKFLCARPDREKVLKHLKRDKALVDKPEGPHFNPRYRHHIKNKSLYPLMNRKEVMYFTLVEGEILRGIITGFSRYEINLNMKQGVPAILFRHSIFDIRDKKGRSYLKSAVEKSKNYW